MREIKFRGKRIDNGKLVYGSLVVGTEKKAYYIFTQDEIAQWVVNPETVGQYTGLQDKNGKDIYEFDVLSNGQHIDWIVVYDEGSFKVKHVGSITNDKWVLTREMAESREVIGNVQENPELIKEG